MNNIYDLFNDRKNEINAICENSQVELEENEFDSIEEGLEYMDELLQESNNDMIEWQAACYMEDLVLEQMMYEDFNADEMEFVIEGSLKERFSGLGQRLEGLWESIKTWFKNMIGKIQDYMMSGEDLFQKYSESEVQQALSNSNLQIKFPELGDPNAAINAIQIAIDKVGRIDPTTAKGAYQNAFIDYAGLGAKDEKGLMTAIKKLIFKLDDKSITYVKSLNAKHLLKYVRYGKVKDLLNKTYKFNEMTFKQAMAAAKGKREAEKSGDVGGQAYYYLLTLRQRMISAFLGAYNQAANACRAVIIKVMNGGDAVKEAALMEEYLDEGFVNRMKMRKMSREEMDGKIGELQGQIDELEGMEARDKKQEKQLKKLRKQLADVQKVKAKKHPDPVEESAEINWDEYDYLDEGLRDKMAAAKAKVGEKVGAVKEKVGEKHSNHKVAKKEKQIAKIRAKVEKRRAEYDEMKNKLEKEKLYVDNLEEEANEEIAELMQEIEAIKNQLSEKKAVAQESFFYDESEIEVLEESLKEKIGQLNDKVNDKITGAIMKFKKNPEKLRAQIAKEQDVIAKLEAIREERGEEDAKWAKAKNAMVASVIGEAIAKGKKGELATNKWIANALKGCRAFISRAEKRLAELEAEKEPAQESFFDFDDDMEDVEEGFINRFKMRKMSKEEFEEKIQGLEARIAELEGMEERDKKQEKELKKLRGQVADAKKVMNKKHPEPAAESWDIDDIEFLD